MITHDSYFKGRDKQYASELRPEIINNAEYTIKTINKLLLACFDDTGIMFDQCNSGWRPLEVNAMTANSGKASYHIKARAIDIADGDGTKTLEENPRILARWTMANERLLEKLGLWCEDPRWTARYNEVHKEWFCWVHYQTLPPGSGKKFYIPTATPPITAPLIPWVRDKLTFDRIRNEN